MGKTPKTLDLESLAMNTSILSVASCCPITTLGVRQSVTVFTNTPAGDVTLTMYVRGASYCAEI